MDVADLVRRLLRRRIAVAVVIVVAVVAAGISWATAATSEQSGAAVVVVPPPLGNAVSDQNPLLNLDGNLTQLAVVLSAAINSADATSQLRARGATESFTVSTTTGDNPSFAQLSAQLVFRVTGSSGPKVERTAAALVAVARSRLAAIQTEASVPTSARATLVQVVAPTSAEVVGGGRLRSAGSIGLAVVVLGLIAVLVWDEFRQRRYDQSAATFRRPRHAGRRRFRRRGVGLSSFRHAAPDGPDDATPVFRSR